MTLLKERVLEILKPNGILNRSLKGFEPREQQQKMMENIIDAYNKNLIALIEAGTGTGKSIAYLIPALIWGISKKERTVISTNTITLQEQLLNKDIPLLTKSLNLEIKAVLVKGMSNYLCLRKLEDIKFEMLLMLPSEREEIQKIDAWGQTTKDGSRSSLSFVPSPNIWEKVCAENDTCNNSECPYYQECHFFKARREANDAQILVVNHHLLFADLALRADVDNYKDPAVLPIYQKIILDEAHHIEDIATEYFSDRINQLEILKILGRLTTEKGTKPQGKLPLLKEKIQNHYRNAQDLPKEISSILGCLNIDLPGTRKDLLQLITATFDAFADFIDLVQPTKKEKEDPLENKLRLLPYHQTHPAWTSVVIPRTQQLIASIKKYVELLIHLDNELERLENDKLNEQIKGIRFEIQALGTRLLGGNAILEEFISSSLPPTKVRWIEVKAYKNGINISLNNAKLEVANALADFLFNKFSSVILCSATLSTNKQFHFIRQRLGIMSELLQGKGVLENIYDSPFNYEQQALLAIPTNVPDPNHPEFIDSIIEYIWQALQASRGNAFVLFTSYTMLTNCFENLEKRMRENRFFALKQGDDNRQSLLNRFKKQDRSILFGTDSFWEGVDVAGEALRCVILVKLPFKVPSEPIIEARSEAILAKGGDPFLEYSLPNAIVKFKQGFGRLIRNKRDRGCIVCLDSRLLKKGYGKQFLNSLPSCQKILTLDKEDLHKQMNDFYKKTYHLVTKNINM